MRGVSLLVAMAVLLGSLAHVATAAPANGALVAGGPATLDGFVEATAPDAFLHAQAPAGMQPFRFEASAQALTVVRDFSNWTVVENPAHGIRGPPSALQVDGATDRETATFGGAVIHATDVRPGAALLVRPIPDGAYTVKAASTTGGAVSTAASALLVDPAHRENEVEHGSVPTYWLRHQVNAPHVRFTAPLTHLTVVGDFAVYLWNISIDIGSDAGGRKFFAGEREEARTGPVVEWSMSNATLVLRGAELRLLPGEAPVETLAERAEFHVRGSIALPSATGVLHSGPGSRYVAANDATSALGDFRFSVEPHSDHPELANLGVGGDFTSISLPVHTSTWRRVAPESSAGWLGSTGALALLGFGTVLAMRHRDQLPSLRRRPHAPADPEEAAEEAVNAIEAGDFARALPALEVALAARPEDADLLIDKGFCLQETGDAQGARLAYERAVLADPGRAESHYYYARSLCALGLNTTALTHLSRAFALDRRLAEQARGDRALKSLRDHPQFVALLGSKER